MDMVKYDCLRVIILNVESVYEKSDNIIEE